MFVCPVCPFVSRLPPVSFYRYVPTDRYTGRRAASFIAPTAHTRRAPCEARALTTRHVQTLHFTVVSPLVRACCRTAQVVGRACSETDNSYNSIRCPRLHRSYSTPIFEWHVLSYPRGAAWPITVHLQ